MAAAEITKFTFTAGDGVQIAAWRASPAAKAKAVVQVAHGMAEHADRYRRLATALTAAGYGVYANDHRGHGGSAEIHGLGSFGPGGFQGLIVDMDALTRVAKRECPGAPLVLLGHSMGSFTAQLYLLEHHGELAALALCGTAAMDRLLDSMIAAGGPAGPDRLNAAFEPARTSHDWLTRDEAEVDAYLADPLCGFALEEAAMASMFALGRNARQDERLKAVRHDLPILVISGQFDPVTGPAQAFTGALIESWREAGLSGIDHRVYPGGRHELFDEINRDDVEADFVAWLDGALSRSVT